MPGETIDIQTPDGTADAYLARPGGDGEHPGVLFVMDAIGLRPRIEEMADRIAAQGYVVLAPNMFYRGGRAPVAPLPDFSNPDSRAEFMRHVRPLIEELTPEIVTRDGGAYLECLAGVASVPVGITGYCMGARAGWRIAGVPHRSEVYAGALHGYTMSDTAVFDEAACERHFTELFALLARTID